MTVFLTADEIASLYTPKKRKAFDEISQKQIIRRVEIPYKQLAETGEVYRCGVNYARAIQMQQEGEYKGRLYLTSEFYPDGRWDHHEFSQYGKAWTMASWQYVGKVEDTEHNKAQYVKTITVNLPLKQPKRRWQMIALKRIHTMAMNGVCVCSRLYMNCPKISEY